jgi:hypothetical protein
MVINAAKLDLFSADRHADGDARGPRPRCHGLVERFGSIGLVKWH